MLSKLKLLLFILLFSLTGCKIFNYTVGHDTYNDVIEESESETSTESETSLEPHIYRAEDLVSYFNAKGEEEGIAVSYIEEENYWYLYHVEREDTDDSESNLSTAISYFLKFIPIYGVDEDGKLFRYAIRYNTKANDIYYVYVAVSSNHYAAISIYSFIEDNHLIIMIVIYDGRNGLYV